MAIPFLTLTVKGPPGLTFPLVVSPELTVRGLKEEVHRLKGESPDSVKIINRGQILSDTSVLRDLELRPGDSLWLVTCIKAVKRGKQKSSAPEKSELPLPELMLMKPGEVLKSSKSLQMPPVAFARVKQAGDFQHPPDSMRPSEERSLNTLPVGLGRRPLPAVPAKVPLPLSPPSEPAQSDASAPINPMKAAAPPLPARSLMAQQFAQAQLSALGMQATPDSTNVFLEMIMSPPYQKLIQRACTDPQLFKGMMHMSPIFADNKELVNAMCEDPEAVRTYQQLTSYMFSEMAKPEPAAGLTTSTNPAQLNTPTAATPAADALAILQEMGFTDSAANFKAWTESGGDIGETISILEK